MEWASRQSAWIQAFLALALLSPGANAAYLSVDKGNTLDAVNTVLSPPPPSSAESRTAANPNSEGCHTPEVELALARDAFCNHSYDWVCGPGNQAGATRDRILADRFATAQSQAYLEASKRYGFFPQDESGYTSFQKKHAALATEMDQAFILAVRERVLKGTSDDPLLGEYFGRIKRSMLLAIDAAPSLTPASKAKMKARVTELHPVDAGKIFRGEVGDADLLRQTTLHCKRTGIADDAFQPPGTDDLVVCPGAIVLMHDDTLAPGANGGFYEAAQVISHESGHTCDMEYFPEEHQGLKQCVQTHYPVLAADMARGKAQAQGYMEEIAADTWSAETLSQIVSSMSDPLRAALLMRSSLRTLCGLPDDGERHPSAQFRIEVLFAKNPRLRRAMGCLAAPAEAPGCALDGATPAN